MAKHSVPRKVMLTIYHHYCLSLLVIVATATGVSSSSSTSSGSVTATSKTPWTSQLWCHTRRILNLSNTFGSATQSATPYDRVAGHPVFQVTTSWGSPYLNSEKLDPFEQSIIPTSEQPKAKKLISAFDEQNEFRQIVLYFLDPDDALAVQSEMKQMENMEKADIRITASSLAKALRQSSNLNGGLTTGVAIDPLDGALPFEDGGALRYKLVPPKRQLYYAARCVGKERVGLLGDSDSADAYMCVTGNRAIQVNNLSKRQEKRDRRFPKSPKNDIHGANLHMEGYSGIPVFYCPQMHRQVPVLKRWLHLELAKQQVPLFFNYEDLIEAWNTMRRRHHKSQDIPEKPTTVEVFNLWDVLTSMDKDTWQKKQQQKAFWKRNPISTLRSSTTEPSSSTTLSSLLDGPDLNAITFVPSSRSIQYKETISTRGNGKARLRPMR